MAEPISLASGVLTLTTFAIESSKALYQAFDSLQGNLRTVRQAKEELENVGSVLASLDEILQQSEVDLSTLKLPLLRYGEACNRFAKNITEGSANSNGSRTSIRDWVRSSYRGRDISAFRTLLESYKSTVIIALADANMRTVGLTNQSRQEYKRIIRETTSDLEDLLDEHDTELQEARSPSTTAKVDDIRHVHEERASIQQCLKICLQVSNHLDEVQAEDLNADYQGAASQAEPPRHDLGDHPYHTNNGRLSESKTEAGLTIADLRNRLREINTRLHRLPENSSGADETTDKSQEMEKQVESLRQCLSTCVDATEKLSQDRITTFDHVTAKDDVHQVIVTTMGDLISARYVSAGDRSDQWLGQIDPASFQQLSKGRGVVYRDKKRPLDHSTGSQFENRHGSGRTLSDWR